jgi:thiol:disulfide interchange protein DsbD
METRRRILVVSMLAADLAALSVQAQDGQRLLPPDEAFKVSARQVAARQIEIEYFIAPGYRLYRDRFAFSTDNPAVQVARVELPPSLVRYDQALGRSVEYYAERVTIRVALAGPSIPVRLTAKAQGCAEVGVCYPPITRAYSVPATGGALR